MFYYLLEKLIEWFFNNSSEHEYKSEDREEITQYLKSKMDKAFRDHKDKMEALPEDFKNKKESTQNKVQQLVEELEKNEGMEKEKERARALEFRLKRKVQQLSRRIQTLQEDLEEWPKIMKLELQARRGAMKNIKGMKKDDIVFALENILKKDMREFSQKTETLIQEVEDCMEAINHELQILRDELEEMKQGKKQEEIALVQETLLKKNMQDFSQKIETVKEDLEESEETIKCELQILRNELEEKDPGMKKEKERARALESRLKRKVKHFSRRIQILQEDVEELPETIMLELQARRGAMKNIKGKKEEDIASAVETLEKKKKREFSQKIETLKEDVEECMETIKYELQKLRDELEEKDPGKKKKDALPLECFIDTEIKELFAQIQVLMLQKQAGL